MVTEVCNAVRRALHFVVFPSKTLSLFPRDFFFQKLGRLDRPVPRVQYSVRSLMLQIVRITVTKAEGSGFGLGLQDYNGGTRIHIVDPGAAGAAVSPDTKAHICTSILDDRDQTYFFA